MWPNGTSDISLAMSYAELPADIKRIVETDTGMSGQQIADLATDAALTREGMSRRFIP